MIREEKAAVLLLELRELQLAAQVARIQSVDPSGEVLVELADEAASLTATDTPRAIESMEMIRSLADFCDHSLARCRVRRGLARALSYAGRFDEALLSCDDAIAIAASAELHIESGRARLASMHALTELGQLDAALDVGQAAQRIFNDLGEPGLSARADINLGVVFQRKDNPSSAVACFDRARPLVQSEPILLGHLENNRGEALLALNDFAGAEAAFAGSLDMSEQAGANLSAAVADGNLADLAARQGHLDRALYHFERARRRLEASKSKTHLARLLTEQAEAKAVLGLPAEALLEYEATLPDLDASGLALEAARARAGIGMTLLRLGRRSEAMTPLAAAATGFQELGHNTARARVDLIRAELFAHDDRLPEARTLVMRALSVLCDRPADSVAARYMLARLALQSGDVTLACNELNTAIDMARQLDLPPLLADLLHTRGRALRQQGQDILALDDLNAAVEAVERVRGTLQADRLRVAYLGRRSEMYESLIEATLDVGGEDAIEQAFAMTEKAKSRTLLDQVGTVLQSAGPPAGSMPGDGRGDGPGDGSHVLEKQLGDVQARLNGLYSRVHDVEPGAPGRGVRSSLQSQIAEAEHVLDEIRGRLSITSGTAGLMAPTIRLEDVRRSLDTDTRLIEYVSIGQELVAFVIGKDDVSVHRGLGTTDQIAHHLSRLRFQMDRALRPGAEKSRRFGRMIADTNEQLGAFWDMLIGPLEAVIEPARRLTIVPHGPLHLVPFHALWDQDRYLLETHLVHYAPSASVLGELRPNRHAHPLERALVVGVADENAPEITAEANAVAEAIGHDGVRSLLGDDASAGAVLEAAVEATVLHLACHGRFAADSPLSSGLRLADRWLTVRDIYSLRIDADLVTLSGCETGVNSVTSGDELMGLLRGFFAAGARSLLVSLWRAHDEATSEFMARFYETWRRLEEPAVPGGGEPAGPVDWAIRDKCAVLADVQLAMMRRWDHPAYWAPFILVGRT